MSVSKRKAVNCIIDPNKGLDPFLEEFSTGSGVYRFYNTTDEVLYVGKARNLRKRIKSYFQGQKTLRLQNLVKKIAYVETTVTDTEKDAFLLESNLIKELKPRYNIVLRDDKSYPYIVLSNHADYPRLGLYRGIPIQGTAQYFGPYPSVSAVRNTLNLLQKLFRIRSCRDRFFQSRKRPCLQYQIQRCSAPCVNKIIPEKYQMDVEQVRLFLQGKDHAMISNLSTRMQAASLTCDYETAAKLRDQIASLRQMQQQQAITTLKGDADVVAITYTEPTYCIYIIPVRSGRMLEGRAYFPKVPLESTISEVLTAFLSQFYLSRVGRETLPSRIIISHRIIEGKNLAHLFSLQTNKSIKIVVLPRGDALRWLQLAQRNAAQALTSHGHTQSRIEQQYQALQKTLGLKTMPRRIVCFDVSHTQGESTVAACVVFDEQGPCTKDYRRFNIVNIVPGDDYAAMEQALMRWGKSIQRGEAVSPDIVLIDGGQAHLNRAQHVWVNLKLTPSLMAIAKGLDRKPEYDRVFLPHRKEAVSLLSTSSVLHLLQQIRDEAHRFAITGHRKLRARKRIGSVLEAIPGIGPKRRLELLTQFGGLQALKQASVNELAKLPSIQTVLAERIYSALRF